MLRTLAVSTVVAVLAASGGAFASSQINGHDIKRGTVTGRQVKDHSLTKRDFKGSVRGPRGRRGLQGPAGPRGATGPQGTAGIAAIVRIDGPAVAQGAFGSGGSEVQAATATCPAGGYAVGGGFITGADAIDDRVEYAASPNTTQYTVVGINYGSSPTTIKAQVICAGGAGVHAASVRSSAAPRAVLRRVARLRARLSARP